MLSSPLPTYPFNIFVDFFSIPNFVTDTQDSNVIGESKIPEEGNDSPTQNYDDEFQQFFALIQNCRNAVSQASRQTAIASALSVQERCVQRKEEKLETNKSTFSASNEFSIALHEALMAVMVERDEAQSELVAERVFHTHELDQERRRNEMLEKKIEYMEKLANEDSASAAAFFLGQEEIPNKHTLGKIERAMVQNVDAELMELCRQLSSEISMRVSSELEILRLKESRKIERETDSAERKILEEKVKFFKEKMEEAQAERDAAMKESESWKKSFGEIVSIDISMKEGGFQL